MTTSALSLYARLGPPLFVDLDPGAEPVARPTVATACWGLVPPRHGVRRFAQCDMRARKGCLTCKNHRRVEAAAKALKARTEGLCG